MLEHHVIEQRVFGIYTKVKNDTSDTSQIRFGGYNQDLFEKDLLGRVSHDLVWIPTVSSNSWKLECPQIDFNHDHLLERPTQVLINPSFPFISAPRGDFVKFMQDLKDSYSDMPLICTDFEFCYYETQCSDISSKINPLIFKLGNEAEGEYFSVPPQSFLFDETEYNDGPTCHLAICGQNFHDIDYWILGDTFMQNYYTVFDA